MKYEIKYFSGRRSTLGGKLTLFSFIPPQPATSVCPVAEHSQSKFLILFQFGFGFS